MPTSLTDADLDALAEKLLAKLVGRALGDALVARLLDAATLALDAQARPARLMTEERLAAEVLDISTRTIRDRLLPAGLPHVTVGDQRRYEPGEVIAWLRAQAAPPPAKFKRRTVKHQSGVKPTAADREWAARWHEQHKPK